MRRLRLSLVAALLLLAVAAPASAGRPTSLFTAVQKVYAPKKVHINEFCYKTFRGRLYALVAVTRLGSDTAATAAFQFRKAPGWAGMWRDGKVLRAIPKRERGHVRAVVKRLHKECA
jgi:hypothetical protein